MSLNKNLSTSRSRLSAGGGAVRESSVALLGALTREAVLVLAGTAVIALVGQLRAPLPFTPVPVTLGTLAVLGVGAVLGSRRGAASALLLALAAAMGAPVLQGFTSGVTASFGYVIGYALVAVVAGRAVRAASWPRRLGLMMLASALVYVPGLAWLAVATGAPLGAVLGMGLAPFVVGDLLKSLLASALPARLSLPGRTGLGG
ncbi:MULTISPECIES: biotin transporter BioY [unclassified Actinomyces]|uniref:biotin transporter BioY n=1 Tax=unclassified Actinomyces TaxID=2609248 RepID=UPI002018055E|nr:MULTISPECIES: biotin transporter BioY [unclassified Actinomyces]MCL3776888.1 biotin transporter BioY [Actinomyces sp. AC-20-1]MCL3790806.1 biotin transporter BioY [Actinomyces sp. 187325]MCL3792255.1 biotin transporter BioY [Actinomyces sp. 186855]MCL3795300.1 biotin transporter BioY [Actinomyces sp. 217892]